LKDDYTEYDTYRIGVTRILYNVLTRYRNRSINGARLFYYFPCQDIYRAKALLIKELEKYKTDSDMYRGSKENFKSVIVKIIGKINGSGKICINKPIIKVNHSAECGYCKKKFRLKHDCDIHILECEVRTMFDREKAEIYNNLVQRITKLEEENRELRKEIPIVQVSNQNTLNKSININSNNTVNIVAFGEEDLYKINDKICQFMLRKGFQSVPRLIEYVHFNMNRPENHNVYIPNMQNNYAMTFDGFDWNLSNRKFVIDQLYEDKRIFLEEKYDQFYSILDAIAQRRFKRYLDSDEVVNTDLKEQIKLLLYNKRKVPMRTKKKYEQKYITN